MDVFSALGISLIGLESDYLNSLRKFSSIPNEIVVARRLGSRSGRRIGKRPSNRSRPQATNQAYTQADAKEADRLGAHCEARGPWFVD